MARPKKQPKKTTIIPVTVLSGFLGSGKTTLLKHILQNKQGWRVAVIVNDMAEVNMDARFVAESIDVRHVKESLVQFENGCICCTLREDLLLEVKRLAKEGTFDYILIESTGISEPLQVAETFTFDDESGDFLKDFARLDTMVTVVDGANAFKDLTSLDFLTDRKWEAGEGDERKVPQLLVEQIEFANVILLNKCDLLSKGNKKKLRSLLENLNPNAKIIETVRSVVDPKEIINTGSFQFEEAEKNPLWLKELRGTHKPETEEYGFSSFVYRARRPFHAGRLNKAISSTKNPFRNCVRAKGVCWISSSMKMCCVWEQAGPQMDMRPEGYWLAHFPRDEWVDTPAVTDAVSKWEEPYGDRRQEMVFIGENMDVNKPKITETLDACLLTDREFEKGPEFWTKIHDPIGFITLIESEEAEGEEEGEVDEAHAYGTRHSHSKNSKKTKAAPAEKPAKKAKKK